MQVFPFLMPRGSGCRLIPLLSPEIVTTSTRDRWAQPAFTWSHPVPYHCSRGQSTGVSSSWQAPSQGSQYRRSGCGHQLQLSCSKGLLPPRLELGREWHKTGHKSAPMVLSGESGGEMLPCSPAQSVTAAVALVVMAQHLCAGHTSQTERVRHMPDPAQLLLQAPVGEQQSGSWGSITAGRTPPLTPATPNNPRSMLTALVCEAQGI